MWGRGTACAFQANGEAPPYRHTKRVTYRYRVQHTKSLDRSPAATWWDSRFVSAKSSKVSTFLSTKGDILVDGKIGPYGWKILIGTNTRGILHSTVPSCLLCMHEPFKVLARLHWRPTVPLSGHLQSAYPDPHEFSSPRHFQFDLSATFDSHFTFNNIIHTLNRFVRRQCRLLSLSQPNKTSTGQSLSLDQNPSRRLLKPHRNNIASPTSYR